MAKEEVDAVVSIFFLMISCGRNVLLHGKFVEVKIWCSLVDVLAKNKLVRYAHSCVFNQTSTRVHQILTSTHNHEVTPYSPTRRWFYQWKWQCSKSWSHSQNSLCSQILDSLRLCLWDAGWRLFTTVYYYVNGKTRRVHSRDVFYWAWITRTWRDAWTIYVTHVIDTRSIRARMQSRRRCVVLWLGKYWISRGRNVLL